MIDEPPAMENGDESALVEIASLSAWSRSRG
jgi:hypothetical protein